MPIESKRKPKTSVDAQFSIPWNIAVAIVKKSVTIGDFTEEAIRDVNILKVAAKIESKLDDRPLVNNVTPEWVEIQTANNIYKKQIDYGYGAPQNPISLEDMINKFYDCVSYSIKPVYRSNADRIVQMCTNLEKVNDITEIINQIN
jgi:2-methylcitrate dehydratase PrpD